MGKITTLKNSSNESLYPVTVPDAIRDENGNKVLDQMKDKIDNHNHDYISSSGGTITGQIYINIDQDAGLNQDGPLTIGDKSARNIAIDKRGIISRYNGATFPLVLNPDGGIVSIGDGGLSVGKILVPSSNGSNTRNAGMNGQVIRSNGSTAYWGSAATKITFYAIIGIEWSGSGPYTQTVSLPGILSTDNPHIMPEYSSNNSDAIEEKKAWSMISKAETANGSITFTCFKEKPTRGYSIIIEVIR